MPIYGPLPCHVLIRDLARQELRGVPLGDKGSLAESLGLIQSGKESSGFLAPLLPLYVAPFFLGLSPLQRPRYYTALFTSDPLSCGSLPIAGRLKESQEGPSPDVGEQNGTQRKENPVFEGPHYPGTTPAQIFVLGSSCNSLKRLAGAESRPDKIFWGRVHPREPPGDHPFGSSCMERAQSIAEKMAMRYVSSQVQFKGDDAVRGAAGISVGGGVPRLIFSGIQKRAIADYARRVAELEAQVKQGVA